MVHHAARLHKRVLGDAIFVHDKRAPEPGLIGDVIDDVGSIAGGAVSGVVGLVTTVVSDVGALVAPQKTTSVAATPASSSTPKASVHTTTTAPSTGNTSISGSTTRGGSSASNGEPNTSSSSSNSSGSSNGNSSSGDSDDRGSDTSGTFSSEQPDGASDNASGASSNSENNVAPSTGVDTDSVATSSVSDSGLLNGVQGSGTVSGSAALSTASPIINAVEAENSDSSRSGALISAGRGTATLSSTSRSISTGASGSGSGNGGDVNGSGASSGNDRGGISSGIIAAIVVACTVLMLVFAILVLRKWHKKRRARRFENWVSRPGAFAFFGGAAVNINRENEKSADGTNSGSASGTRSARSSFGTTFDQGLRPFSLESLFVPSPASVSQIHATVDSPTSFLTGPSVPVPLVVSVQRPDTAVDRRSLLSQGSRSSYGTRGASGSGNGNTNTEVVVGEVDGSTDGHAQYLLAPQRQGQESPGGAQLSPISVRPWSPSERWAFPKPPTGTGQVPLYYQPPASPSTYAERVPVSPLPPLSAVGRSSERDPFADPPQALVTSESLPGIDGMVDAVEYIRRPFMPTLADELTVQRGDVIRILQAFDDGWVQVEKVSSASDAKPNSPGESSESGLNDSENERGLIPVDCLREAGEALPSFLASRRVSSYYGGVAI